MRVFSVTKWVCAAAFLTVAVFHADAATVTAGLTIYSPGLQNGLVGHWTFDGKDMVSNVADASSGGNTGRLILSTSGNTATTTANGPIGQALMFDGTNDYVTIADDTSLDVTSAITVAGWVKLDIKTRNQGVAYKGSFANAFGPWALSYTQSSSPDGFYWTIGNSALIAITSDASADVWYHVAGTYDGQTARVYLNGVLEDSDAYGSPTNLATDNNTVQLGRYFGTSVNRYLQGALDDVRIYNRALSPSEVKRLYMLGAGMRFGTPVAVNTGSGQGLVGHWTFDGKNLISNATDSSGQGKHGVLFSDTVGQTATTTAPGVLGQGLVFDGVDDWINITDTTNFTAYTISAWVKPAASGNQNILVYTQSSPLTTWSHQIRISSGTAQHYTYDGGLHYVTGSTPITPGSWYHIVATAKNGGTARLYVNGVEEGSPASGLGTLWNDGEYWFVGSNSGHSMGYFNGLMDDVRLYNRALTPDEIKHLYQSGVGARITPQ